MHSQLIFAQYGLCVPPRFTLIVGIRGQDEVLPSVPPMWAFYQCFQVKSQPTVMQTDRAAIFMSHVRGTTPAAQFPSLRKALA